MRLRRAEFGVRLALGASRLSIVRQVLVESVLLAAVSGVAALAVSMVALQWFTAVKPMNTTGFWSQYARTFDYFAVSLEPRVAAFNFAVALGAGLLFGLLPARHASRTNFNDSLKQRGAEASAGGRRLTARGALVLAEIALSIVLLVCAGLMARSFARATSADLGFAPEGVITMVASPPGRRPVAFYRQLADRIAAIPGVQASALLLAQPLGGGSSNGPIDLDAAAEPSIRADLNVVTPSFFDVFRIQRVEGRVFDNDDRELAPRVAVVNRTFARNAWPGESALGKRVRTHFRVAYGDPKAWTTVIGVVDDVVYDTLEEPRGPMIYLTAWQPLGTPAAMAMAPTTIALRTPLGSAAAAAAVREQVPALDAATPIYDVATMEERAARVTARYRYASAMMGSLAALALLLAAIGTYGVIAYTVATRTREIGIRIALGARPADVLGLIVGGGLRLAAAGIVLGLAGALAGSRVLGSMLYGVTPHDPATFGGIALLMAGAALLASYLPARRAMRVDPVVALRQD